MKKISQTISSRAQTVLLIICAATLYVGIVSAGGAVMAIGQGQGMLLQFSSQEIDLQETQDEDEVINARDRTRATHALSRLTSRDPLIRQGAAEELARLSTVGERRRMIEGYRLQERNERVRLALDWSLYRAGKRETLINIVRELSTPRRNQAQSYLLQLDNPEPLYAFLQRINIPSKIVLLQVLGQIGNRETLEIVTPLTASLDPQIAGAARSAVSEINRRMASTPESATRPRRVNTESTP
jgi:hypothetical protein